MLSEMFPKSTAPLLMFSFPRCLCLWRWREGEGGAGGAAPAEEGEGRSLFRDRSLLLELEDRRSLPLLRDRPDSSAWDLRELRSLSLLLEEDD